MLSHCQEHTTLPLQMQHMNAIDMSSHQKTPLLRAESGRTEGSLVQPNLAKGRKLRPLPSTTMYSYVTCCLNYFELILFFIRALTCIVCDVSTSTIWTSFHLSCW